MPWARKRQPQHKNISFKNKSDMTQNISQTPNTNDEQTFGYRQDNDTFFNALTINIEEPGTLEDLFHALNPKDMTFISPPN